MSLKLDIQLDKRKLGRIRKRLDPSTFSAFIKDATKGLAINFENQTKDLLNQRIYQQPESPNYRRTHDAIGGHLVKNAGEEGQEIVFDTRISGAVKNYTPFLNRNRRIKKLNTLFFDDSVKMFKKSVGKLLDKEIEVYFKKIS